MKVKGSAEIYSVAETFRSPDEIRQLSLLIEMENPLLFVQQIGFLFAVHFSPVENKPLFTYNQELKTEFEAGQGPVASFYLDREHMKRYTNLCLYLNHIVLMKVVRMPFPFALYIIMFNNSHQQSCNVTAVWMVDNFGLRFVSKYNNGAKMFFVMASKYLHAERYRKSHQKIITVSAIDLDYMPKTKEYIPWEFTENIMNFFDCLMEYADHVIENYRADGHEHKNVKKTVDDGDKLTVLSQHHFDNWVQTTQSVEMYNFLTTSKTLCCFGRYLLYHLLVRRMLPNNQWGLIMALRIFKKIKRAKIE